jgi:hypothetical protein
MLMLPTTHTFFLVAYGIHQWYTLTARGIYVHYTVYIIYMHTRAGIFIQSMGARKRGGIGSLYKARQAT